MTRSARVHRRAVRLLVVATALALVACGGDAASSAPECRSPDDCPGQDGFCGLRTCTGGVCGIASTVAGTALPDADQTAGDCRVLRCDGAGGTTSAAEDADLPVDQNACTLDVCTAGVPRNPPASPGATCAEGARTICDGLGACVECVSATTCPGTDGLCSVRACIDGACGFTPTGACVACVSATTCPGTDGPCGVRTCTDGTCGFSATTSGTALPGEYQAAGDCHILRCNGFGTAVSSLFDIDVPVDGNACTLDVCTGGTPTNPPAPAGTPCGPGGGVCDGAGACVG